MPRAPLLLPALAFVGAIAADAYALAALACSAAAGALVWRAARPAAAFALAGLLCAAWRGHPAGVLREVEPAVVRGSVVSDVAFDGAGASFVLASAGLQLRAHVQGTVAAGERLALAGRLEPLDEPRNPGEPSARALGRAQGIGGAFSGRVTARAPPEPLDVRTWPARARAALSHRLRAVLREPEAGVVAGALWGERGELPHALRDDFQATGTVHVLVTAGLHLGVIAALALGVCRLLRVPRVPACIAAIPVVAAYAWLSGGHLPSERAAVMVCVGLLARACGARIVSWNSLALAALAVAALRPAAVTSVSFALSFSCVSAIVMFARPLEAMLERKRLPGTVREALALTIATQLGVWPLSAAVFGLVAPYAVLANAAVVPLTGAAMLAGITTLVTAGLPGAARAAAAWTALLVDAMLCVVRAVAALPGARVSVAPPAAFAIVAYDVAALIAARLLATRPRAAAALLAAACCGVLLTTLRPPDGRLTITMLDVGQADAIVIRTPRGRTILIDSGGRLERGPAIGGLSPAEAVAERVVLSYLRRQGIREIALLVNTHPHGDHVGGCLPIVQALRVGAIGDSGQEYGGRAFRDCLAAARSHGVPIVLVRKGMHYTTGDGVAFDALAPAEPLLADGRNDVNENSLVLMMTYRCAGCAEPFRMLFMGDAGAQTEARLLASGIDLAADVLKVGHHGSAYASTPAFIASLHPRYALISVGRHNIFGHPAAAALATLRSARADIFRTDQCGAIVLTSPPSGRAIKTAVRCAVLEPSRDNNRGKTRPIESVTKRLQFIRLVASSQHLSSLPAGGREGIGKAASRTIDRALWGTERKIDRFGRHTRGSAANTWGCRSILPVASLARRDPAPNLRTFDSQAPRALSRRAHPKFPRQSQPLSPGCLLPPQRPFAAESAFATKHMSRFLSRASRLR